MKLVPPTTYVTVAHIRAFSDGLSFNPVPISGATWWFRYLNPGFTCQLSAQAVMKMNLCADFRLRSDILLGSPQVNAVWVYYSQNEDGASDNIYRKRRKQIRNALESNACPNEAIDNSGLPNIKFLPGVSGTGIHYLCSSHP